MEQLEKHELRNLRIILVVFAILGPLSIYSGVSTHKNENLYNPLWVKWVFSGFYMLYFFGTLWVDFIKTHSRKITLGLAYTLSAYQLFLLIRNDMHHSFTGGYIFLGMLVILYIKGYRQVLTYSISSFVALGALYLLYMNSAHPMRLSSIISLGIINLVFTILKFYILNKDVRIRQYSRQLSNSEQKYRNLLESAPDAIISVDSTGTILGLNKRTCDLFLYAEHELKGKKIDLLIPRRYHAEGMFDAKSYSDSPKTLEASMGMELFAVNKKGEEFPVGMSLNPVIDSENKHVIAIIRDVSRRLKAEKELNEIKLKLQEKELAEKVSLAKSEFISKMSHEIRTPLNGIYGFTNILLKEDIAPEHKKYIENIKFSSELLNVLINDILDNTNLESGNITLENNEIDIRKLTENVLETFRIRLSDKNITTGINYCEKSSGDVVAVGDFLRISQIIMNLLSNAIKFSYEGGKIEINTELTEHAGSNLEFLYSITDYGIGIPEEKIKDIFQPFVQVSSEISKKYGGNGLGLSIVKHLVDKMGGEVSVSSGDKTVFSFKIPLKKAGERDEDPLFTGIPDMELDRDLKILVVEDNLMNQFLVKTILDKKGIRHEIVENGKQALLKLQVNQYEIILMDLMMPEMDGIACARVLRNELRTDAYIIALTADVKASVNSEINELFDAYMKKPFEETELMKHIYACTQGARATKIS